MPVFMNILNTENSHCIVVISRFHDTGMSEIRRHLHEAI